MNKEFQEMYETAQEFSLTKPRQTVSIGREMIKRGRQEKDYEAVAYGHFVAGSGIFAMGMEHGLMFHATQAVMYFKKTDDAVMLARSLNLQGIAYTASEEFQLSLMTYMEAYQLAVEHKMAKYRKDVMLNNIAACYFSLGDHKKALHIMERVYKSAPKYMKKDPQFVFNITCNLADVSCEMQEYEKALEYAKKAGELLENYEGEIEKLLHSIVMTKIYYGMGDRENGNKWSDNTVSYFEAGIDTFEAHRDYEKIVLTQLDIGEDDRADKYADFLWDEAQRTGSIIDKLRSTRMQAKYFDLQDNTRLALYYYREMDKLSEQRNRELLKNQLDIAKNNEILAKQLRKFDKLMKEKENMEILASRDSLTGLLNRSALSKIIELYVKRSKKNETTIGCIFLDVDCFKEYNDTYGHVKGDECLIKIAEACKTVEGEHCYFARYGGDEFFCISCGLSDEEMKEKAFAIVDHVKQDAMEHKASKVSKHVTVSVGVVNMVLDEESNLLDVVNFTDRALYHSKEKGKNCIYMFDDDFFKEKNDMNFIKVN